MCNITVHLKKNINGGYDVIEEKEGKELFRKNFSEYSSALNYVNKNYGKEVIKNIEQAPAPYRSPRP